MDFESFDVRLANPDNELGYEPGLIGEFKGMQAIPGENGQQVAACMVIWFNVDEETGERSIGDFATPDFKLPQELRAHVDPAHWPDDEFEIGFDETDDETDDDDVPDLPNKKAKEAKPAPVQ